MSGTYSLNKEQVSALFPQEKEPEVDYKRKYELLVAYLEGVADAVQGQDVSAQDVLESIQGFIMKQGAK